MRKLLSPLILMCMTTSSVSHAVARRTFLQMMGGLVGGIGRVASPVSPAATTVVSDTAEVSQVLRRSQLIAMYGEVGSYEDAVFNGWQLNAEWIQPHTSQLKGFFEIEKRKVERRVDEGINPEHINFLYSKLTSAELDAIGSRISFKLNEMESKLAREFNVSASYVQLAEDFILNPKQLNGLAFTGGLKSVAAQIPLTDDFVARFLCLLVEILPSKASSTAIDYNAWTEASNREELERNMGHNCHIESDVMIQSFARPFALKADAILRFNPSSWRWFLFKAGTVHVRPVTPEVVADVYLNSISRLERARQAFQAMPKSTVSTAHIEAATHLIDQLTEEYSDFPNRYSNSFRALAMSKAVRLVMDVTTDVPRPTAASPIGDGVEWKTALNRLALDFPTYARLPESFRSQLDSAIELTECIRDLSPPNDLLPEQSSEPLLIEKSAHTAMTPDFRVDEFDHVEIERN